MSLSVTEAGAETAAQWVALGTRVHGGFGSLIALGIRLGRDARNRLGVGPRRLHIEYQDGPSAPCSCVVDGIMLATVSTPGQGLLYVRPTTAAADVFGIAVLSDPKTGRAVRYVLPRSDRALMDAINAEPAPMDRYQAVMSASAQRLFRVEELRSSRAAAYASRHTDAVRRSRR